MNGIIKLKYIQSSIGEHEVIKSYSDSEVVLKCSVSKDYLNKEFLNFDFKYPSYNLESSIKHYFEILESGEDTFTSTGNFSISISTIIKNNSDELIICGILSIIDFNKERVDNFTFIIKIVHPDVYNYFNNHECFSI
jgi:hypothetical protein